MDREDIEYWIWLQQAMGAGSPKPDRLLRAFGGIRGVYEANQAEYLETGFLSEKEVKRLNNKSLEKSESIVEACMKFGYRILTPNQMPQRLRDIYAPPCVLYMWGSLPKPEESIYISMVGTRNVTSYGVEAATKISAGLAHYGAVVVSGMALGVDAASHKGALKGGGKTIAVIGCGIDIDYPMAHRELKRLISQNGAVVSEYAPGSRPDRANFPIRNRIIAGLSFGTVVVEAGSRSGSLITASLAAEMGRDIFAVPGSIFNLMSEGTNKLLRDGAKPVCTVMDIMEEYIGLYPQSIIAQLQEKEKQEEPVQLSFQTARQRKPGKEEKIKTQPEKSVNPQRSKVFKEHAAQNAVAVQAQSESDSNNKNIKSPYPESVTEKTAELSETQKAVFQVLTDTPMHVDEISLAANLELRRVLAVLTTLEIEGFVRSYPGRRYTVME